MWRTHTQQWVSPLPGASTWPGRYACLATRTHAAKFPEAVNEAVGKPIARHPALEALKDKPYRRTVIPADIDAVRQLIRERAPEI